MQVPTISTPQDLPTFSPEATGSVASCKVTRVATTVVKEKEGVKKPRSHQFTNSQNQSSPLSKLSSRLSRVLKITTPLSFSELTQKYESDFETLSNHLLNLSNPYLVRHLCETIKTSLEDGLDISDEKNMGAKFTKSAIPQETMGYFEKLFSRIYSLARSDPANLEKIYKQIVADIQDLLTELLDYADKISKGYEGWSHCELLFKIPMFSRLKDADFRKLMKIIEEDIPDNLVDYVDELDQLNVLDRKAAERYLIKQLGYSEDLNTLLSEMIEKKPKKNEGVFTYWNHPPQFFVHKTLHINSPKDISFMSTIEGFEAVENKRIFHFQDKSVLIIEKEPFSIKFTKKHGYKLCSAIINETIKNDDFLTIEHPSESTAIASLSESTAIASLKVGDYILKNKKSQTGNLNFELWDPNNISPIYRITRKKEEPILKIQEWNHAKECFENGRSESFHAFESNHRALKKEIQKVSDINPDNVDKCILIKEEQSNEEQIRRHHLELVKKDQNEILSYLKQKKELLDKLIENLVTHQIAHIDFALLEKEDITLANKIKTLSKKFKKDLKIERPPSEILKQVVLEANYSVLIHKQDNVLVARALELLRLAYKHAENITGHDLILFMGNTGSGKSTSISFLMGAKLEEFSNHVGEKVLKVNEPNGVVYPKIGQAIGTSETIYTQGYKLPNSEYMLGDCPGFNDTRGGDYELCTNFSIDQAVTRANKIRAVVLVLPAATFVEDRGNHVIELINTVKKKFLGTFDPNDSEKSNRIFLLITKQKHVHPEVVKKLRDGTRFSELIKESEKQIQELAERYGEDSIEIQPSKARQDIWRAIYQMQIKNQVRFITTVNNTLRKELLQLYSQEGSCINKSTYLPAMQTDYMQKQFGDCILMSTHTWSTLIFEEYKYKLPKEIQKKEQAIIEKKAEVEDLLRARLKQLESAKENLRLQEELDNYLNQLSKRQHQLTKEDLKQELAKTLQYIEECVGQEKLRLSETEQSITKKIATFLQVNKEIMDLESQYEATKSQITILQKEVESLQTGVKTETLFLDSCQPGKHKALRWESENAINLAEKKSSELPIYFNTKEEEIDTSTFEGTTGGVAIIKRGYRLVPADPLKRSLFFTSGNAEGYVATVEGFNYKIGIGQAHNENTVVYQYRLDWPGNGEIPWIKISYTIPMCKYNHAAIKNLKSDIVTLNNVQSTILKELYGGEGIAGLLSKAKDLENELGALEKLKIEQEKSIEELNRNHSQTIADHLEQNKKLLETYKQRQKQLEDTTSIDEKINQNQLEIKNQIKLLTRIQEKLRNLAIVIVTQWENAELLKDFADLAIAAANENTQKEIIASCKTFIEMFTQIKDHLPQEIQSKYGFKPLKG